MTDEFVELMYEEGRTLAEIAEVVGKTVSEITALLDALDGDEDEQARQDRKHLRDLRRMRSLADTLGMNYMEDVKAILADPELTLEEKREVYGKEIDTVFKYSKLMSDRVLLAEGKMTENIGLYGESGLPFQVNFTKTYETPEDEPTDDN